MSDLELLDILVTTDEDDEPRLKVGDAFSGKGVGQDVAMMSSDGFIGQPNPSDSSGNAGQAIVLTEGNDRFIIASSDGRYLDKVSAMAPGDRAIVSNCDAALLLQQAGNKISIQSTGMSLVCDGAEQTLTLTLGQASIQLGSSGITISFTAGPNVSSITLNSTGIAIVVPPGTPPAMTPTTITVNGVALVVP